MRKKGYSISVCMMAAAAMLFACGEEPDSGRGKKPEPSPQPVQEQPDDQILTPDEYRPDPDWKDPTISVDNPEDLIEAIAPNAWIELAPGEYNISEYINDVWQKEGEQWNEDHRYVKISEVYDGLQLEIQNTNGLQLLGGSDDPADTVLLADPRYAAVLTFRDCDSLTVSGMTMGHTERGECWGSVIDFLGCSYIKVTNMDLFGCGVIGLNLEDCTGGMYCGKTTIRECSMGPLWNDGSTGKWTFDNCRLVDSQSGGFFSESPDLIMKFEFCEFGDRETENFQFRTDTETRYCTWGTVQNYPEYYEEEDPKEYSMPLEFHPENIRVVPFDKGVLSGTYWNGFAVIDEDTGETTELALWLTFFDDGTGTLEENNVVTAFTWELDSDYSAVLSTEDAEFGKLSLYADPNEKESALWLYLSSENVDSWFY